MSDLPSVSGKDVVKAFVKLGFTYVRTKGSHFILKRDGHPLLVAVPVHANKPVKKGTLHGAIGASGFSEDQFLDALK